MALMLPRGHLASSIRPVMQERRFRLDLRCNDCRHLQTEVIELVDEPNDPATVEDFFESGAIDRMQYACERCGCESGTLLDTTYLQAPNEARGLE